MECGVAKMYSLTGLFSISLNICFSGDGQLFEGGNSVPFISRPAKPSISRGTVYVEQAFPSEHCLHVLTIIRGQNKEETYCFFLKECVLLS